MKKKFLIAASVVLAASAGVFAYLNSESKADTLFSANEDALAGCEISNKGGQIIFSCSGENTCSISYGGKTLTCDGTQH